MRVDEFVIPKQVLDSVATSDSPAALINVLLGHMLVVRPRPYAGRSPSRPIYLEKLQRQDGSGRDRVRYISLN